MRITDFKHVSVFILRPYNIKKPQIILVPAKKSPETLATPGCNLTINDKEGSFINKTFINNLSPIPANLYDADL